MSSHQYHQYYNADANSNVQDEYDALLNSLVGSNQQGSVPYNSNQEHYNYYNSYNNNNNSYPNGPPPALPPRNESNGYIRNTDNYYYPSENTYNNNYGYPPPPPHNQYPNYTNPATPLPARMSSIQNNEHTYPPDNNYMYPPQNNISMPMPQYTHQRQSSNGSNDSAGVYPPPQYHHQRNPSQGTPPGSPSQRHLYPSMGYSEAAQAIINSSYRPHFTTQTTTSTSSDTLVSTPPPLGFTPPPQVTSHRRNPSSLRNNMIVTIERPRYSTEGVQEDGELPFIPVSPDTSSDEEEYFPPPPAKTTAQPTTTTTTTQQPIRLQEQAPEIQQHYQEPQQQHYQEQQPTEQHYNEPQQQQHYQPEPQQQHYEEQRYNEPQQEYYQETQHYEPEHQHHDKYYQEPQQKQPEPQQGSTQFVDPSHFYYDETLDNLPQPQVGVLQPVSQTIEADTAPPPKKAPEPNYGLLSTLSIAFSRHVKGLEHVRELWCASEYNESFTGSEAITIIQNLLKVQVTDDYCILVLNALMRNQPPLFSPTQYSQKSLISNCVNADDTYFLEEDIDDDYTPVGVLPSITPCYSPSCEPGQGGCYAFNCPNTGRDFVVDVKVETTVSTNLRTKTISSPVGGWLVSHDAWSARMDKELLQTLTSKEIARQEVLNETIYSEEKYLEDLKILDEVIVKGIKKSGLIESDRVHNFITTIFSNYLEIMQLSESMFKDMLARYRQYDGEVVPTIGDILVQHMQFFEEAYVKYSPQTILAKYIVESEMRSNPDFNKFIEDFIKHERTNRLTFWNFLQSPVTRLQRYPLLIDTLLRKTPEDHPDHAFLKRSYDIIRSVATKADNNAVHIKKRLAILQIRDSITFKQGELYELQLSDPNRRIYHKGYLKRRSGSLDVADKNDIYAFVFDHMILMTKLRKTNTGEEYRIWKKPIPLQLLVVQNTTSAVPAGTVGAGVTLNLHHLGSRGGSVYPFFCSSVEERQTWTKAIDDAKTSLRKRQGDADVFDLRPLDDTNFKNIGYAQATGTTTRINCSVPFMSAAKERKIAIGTDNGVFFKTEGQDNSVRRIIQCESVIQLAVIEKFHILIVLTEKALRAYPVDALDSKSNTRATDRIEVEIAQHVNFFQIGLCNNRDMLVFKKKKNTTSVFTALEPFCDLRDPKNEKLLTHKPSLFSNRPDYLRWFKKYKDFYIGAEASNIHFLKAKLNIVCERGFEVIDPENLTVGRDIPDSEDPEFYFVTRHQEPLKPLAMYRISDKFLLCYDKFAFYVNNRNGSLVPRPDKRKPATICDWEGTPTHVVYEHPFIIAIDPYFIEIRTVDTGELVQIISGENIRLAYYNGGGDKPIIHVCMSHSQKPDTQALFHLALNPNNRYSTGHNRR